MSAGVLMLGMLAWVLMSAVIVLLFVLLQVIHEKIEELNNSIYEDDGTDEWLA
jgi:hypothetical protein